MRSKGTEPGRVAGNLLTRGGVGVIPARCPGRKVMGSSEQLTDRKINTKIWRGAV
jgi:hypothetical protein